MKRIKEIRTDKGMYVPPSRQGGQRETVVPPQKKEETKPSVVVE